MDQTFEDADAAILETAESSPDTIDRDETELDALEDAIGEAVG